VPAVVSDVDNEDCEEGKDDPSRSVQTTLSLLLVI
jgi:hypothetical protein